MNLINIFNLFEVYFARNPEIAVLLIIFLFFVCKPSEKNHVDVVNNKSAFIQDAGKVEHIFFHPLIVYPEKAFYPHIKYRYLENWFVTISEYKKIIQSLYERNYILVALRDLYSIKNNRIFQKELYLPVGKQPIIISIDDLNYYPEMVPYGIAQKLILKDGEFSTEIINSSGKLVIEKNAEVISVLQKFLLTHNDFSHNGARMLLALTGYNGLYGYVNTQENEEEIFKITTELKSRGYEFASHGYAHLETPLVYDNQLKADTERWLTDVGKYTGETPYYVYPFGAGVSAGSTKFELLKKYGFKFFFDVNVSTEWFLGEEYLLGSRVAIDGRYMRANLHSSKVSSYFDIRSVIDSQRR